MCVYQLRGTPKAWVSRFGKVVDRIALRGIAVIDLLEREFSVLSGLVIAF